MFISVILWMITLVYMIMNHHHLLYNIQQSILFKGQLIFLKCDQSS